MIKAIDTEYKGHLFRSRLEARYAVYFDNLGVIWEYESEGYELGEGDRYLPDFYLPTYGIFAEVKPIPFDYKEHSKCKRLAVKTRKIVVELVGLPNTNPKDIIVPHQYYACSSCGKKEEYDINDKRIYCKCKAKHNIVTGINIVEGFLLFQSDKKSYSPIYYGNISDCYTEDKRILEAVNAATKARFEFQKNIYGANYL